LGTVNGENYIAEVKKSLQEAIKQVPGSE